MATIQLESRLHYGLGSDAMIKNGDDGDILNHRSTACAA